VRPTIGPRPTTQWLGKNSSESPCSVAAFVVKSKLQTVEKPSVYKPLMCNLRQKRLCVVMAVFIAKILVSIRSFFIYQGALILKGQSQLIAVLRRYPRFFLKKQGR
jgi:hypothetical protein